MSSCRANTMSSSKCEEKAIPLRRSVLDGSSKWKKNIDFTAGNSLAQKAYTLRFYLFILFVWDFIGNKFSDAPVQHCATSAPSASDRYQLMRRLCEVYKIDKGFTFYGKTIKLQFVFFSDVIGRVFVAQTSAQKMFEVFVEEKFPNRMHLNITHRDLQSLIQPKACLNDNIINFYLQLICKRSELDATLPKVCALAIAIELIIV